MGANFIDLFCLALAPFTGGFLSVIITRVPAQRGWINSRSACGICSTQLAPRDLIPLFSWMSTGGRCRHCRAPVPYMYPLLEIATITIAIACVALTNGMMTIVACIAWNAVLTMIVMDFRRTKDARPLAKSYLFQGEMAQESLHAPGADALWTLSRLR